MSHKASSPGVMANSEAPNSQPKPSSARRAQVVRWGTDRELPVPEWCLRQRTRRRDAVPIEIVWSVLARTRLQEIRAYVARDKPEAAERLATRIVTILEALGNILDLGRAGTEPGIRELVIGGTPYIVLYRVQGRRVTISTIGTQLSEEKFRAHFHSKTQPNQ